MKRLIFSSDKTQDKFDDIANKMDEMIDGINSAMINVEGLSKSFAQMRLDLKGAGVLHDEPYIPPGVDELSEQPQQPPKKSEKTEKLEKDDPF